MVNILRLDDLEDPAILDRCFEALNQAETLSANPTHKLEAKHKSLLDDLFKNDLKEKSNNVVHNFHLAPFSENTPSNWKTFADFEKSVIETSLIDTLFSWTNPEIGQLLHLPEMDSQIVQDYDRDIVYSWIRKFVDSLVVGLDLPSPDALQEYLQGTIPQEKITKYKKMYSDLQQEIEIQYNMTSIETEELKEKKWKEVREKVKKTVDQIVEKEFLLSPWNKALMIIPLAIPLGIWHLMKWQRENAVEQQALEKKIEETCAILEEAHQLLQKLKELEALVGDKAATLAKIKENGMALETINENLKRNKTIVLLAVTQNGLALQYAADRLKKDREVVLAAVTQNGSGISICR